MRVATRPMEAVSGFCCGEVLRLRSGGDGVGKSPRVVLRSSLCGDVGSDDVVPLIPACAGCHLSMEGEK